MTKAFLAGIMALGMVSVATPALAGDQDFTLINKTGLVFDEVYISASNKDDWEEDVLGKDVLNDGEEWDIEFDGENECEFDMKVVDVKGKDHIFKGINLCKLTKLTLSKKGNQFVYTWVND